MKASITTDSVNIVSIAFSTLVTANCTCKLAKGRFQTCAVVEMYNVLIIKKIYENFVGTLETVRNREVSVLGGSTVRYFALLSAVFKVL